MSPVFFAHTMKKSEKNIQTEVLRHYEDAKQTLDTRITHKERGFDVYDKVFRNYIEPASWPFSARVPDGRGSSLIKRKTDRLLANKLQGRLVARKEGTELGARIGSELIMHQWNESDMFDDEPMLMKWRRMDMNARKYGASFGLCTWRTDGEFSGPWFEVLENRDVLLQPGAKSVTDSEWVQVRRYVTISELERINDVAKSGPIYDKKAIEKLKKRNTGGDAKDHTSVNKSVIGLSSQDKEESNNRIAVVTEYRTNRKIVFAPSFSSDAAADSSKGIILQDIENPYDHGEIAIVRLVYEAIDDDIYGVPELEPVLPLIKANWALICQYLEGAQNELYTPLMVNPLNVQLETLEFKAGARWLMQRPGEDVKPYVTQNVSMQKFIDTYGLLTSLIMEGVGETGQDVSNMSQAIGTEKTATEIKDQAMLRTTRDNANKVILQMAIAKMVYFWLKMDQQFIDNERLIRIVGEDALKYLVDEGLHDYSLQPEGYQMISDFSAENGVTFEEAYEVLRSTGALEEYAEPLYPSNTQGLPKLILEEDGKSGFLRATKDDIKGTYDYLVDIEAMGLPNEMQDAMAMKNISDTMLQTQEAMAQAGWQVQWKEFISKMGEKVKIRDMEQYFKRMEQPMPGQMPEAGGIPEDQGGVGARQVQNTPIGGIPPMPESVMPQKSPVMPQ